MMEKLFTPTNMVIIVIVAILLVAVLVVVLVVTISRMDFSGSDSFYIESDIKRAGRRGEQFANTVIREILKEGDVLLSNVRLSYDGKNTELDNLIINNRGLFVIEVKNYSGDLVGGEEDYEWIQSKMTPGGYFYQKTVKNPIKQVDRQVYILANYLKQYGYNVWVEGYAFLAEMNSPVESKKILRTQADIRDVIHHGYNNNLTEQVKGEIVKLL